MGTVSLHQCMGHSMAMASLAPLISLVRDEYVQEQLAETARQFFSNSFLTVSLWPSIIVGVLFLLLGFPLLTMIFGDSAGATGYGAPEPSYGAPEPSYGAPSSSYGYRRSTGWLALLSSSHENNVKMNRNVSKPAIESCWHTNW